MEKWETAPRRAWKDTKDWVIGNNFKTWLIIAVCLAVFTPILTVSLTPLDASRFMNGVYGFIGAILALLITVIIVYLYHLIITPYHQRNEARKKVDELEEKRLPRIEVYPVVGQPKSPYESNNKTAWAELKVKNSSSVETLQDVSVQIVELFLVLECQDNRGSYFLYDDKWNPSNVYWSERNVPPNQLSTSIAPKGTKFALIAYHPNSAPALGYLNTPTRPPMSESRIVVEVSSANSPTYRGTYYIEYHQESRNEFEFVEWDSWCKIHKVIEQTSPGKAGSPNV